MDNGYYSNRWFIGGYRLEQGELEELRELGILANYTGYGVMVIGDDVDEEFLFGVVESIKVKGKVICPKTAKEHYGLK